MGRGEYGRCEQCGVEIPTERLRILPAITLCLPCARRAERVMH